MWLARVHGVQRIVDVRCSPAGLPTCFSTGGMVCAMSETDAGSIDLLPAGLTEILSKMTLAMMCRSAICLVSASMASFTSRSSPGTDHPAPGSCRPAIAWRNESALCVTADR